MNFFRRHKRQEEDLAEAAGLAIAWRILIALCLGAGTAAAAVTVATSSPKPGYRNVPLPYAAPTAVQLELRKSAKANGPGHGIYVWGGNGPYSFDCSGYVNYVYRHGAGISLPGRSSFTLWASSASRVSYSDLRLGDVVFFKGSDGTTTNPGHVGLYMGGHQFIEYYQTGLPARLSHLPRSDYIGAKRWYAPAQVPKKFYFQALYPSKHWGGIRIAGSSGNSVTYLPEQGHKDFKKSRRLQIVAWAHKAHYSTAGTKSKLVIRF